MGQRANLVIVRNGDWRLFYDHWCANRLDVELFWGPELASSFIEQREPLADRDGWLDEVWCEGGAILDWDARVLTWFGGEDITCDVPLRRVFFELMQRQWPGWQLRWATGAIVELGAYLHLPAEKFLVNRGDQSGEFKVLTEYPEDNDTLLTVRRSGRTAVARIYGDEDALAAGSAQLPTLLGVATEASLVWTGNMPIGGLHIDVDARSLHYWRANPTCAMGERVASAWPGWRAESLGDRFEAHLELAQADCRLPHRPASELQREILDHLRRCCTHDGRNPAREIAATIGATKISPWTDEVRGSVGDEPYKLGVLDALERACSDDG